MFEKLGNKTQMENMDNMVTNAYAQIDKVIHRGNSFEENIEMYFANITKLYETHAYCLGSIPKKDSRLYQSSKK
eukprot:12772655-Heterocapsa_arctica.AAC.1